MKTILKVSEVYQGTWFNKALTQRFNLCNYFESYQLCNKLPCQTNIDRVQHNKNKVSEKVMLDLSKIFRIYTNFKFCVSCCPCHHHHHHHTEHQHFHWKNNLCFTIRHIIQENMLIEHILSARNDQDYNNHLILVIVMSVYNLIGQQILINLICKFMQVYKCTNILNNQMLTYRTIKC